MYLWYFFVTFGLCRGDEMCCCGAVYLDWKLWLVLLHLVSRRWIQVRRVVDTVGVEGEVSESGLLFFALFDVIWGDGCVWTVK